MRGRFTDGVVGSVSLWPFRTQGLLIIIQSMIFPAHIPVLLVRKQDSVLAKIRAKRAAAKIALDDGATC